MTDASPTPDVVALSIHQPWIEMIVCGIKQVENRRWTTTYRGPLVLHASQSLDTVAYESAVEAGFPIGPKARLVRGAYLGVAVLVDVHRDGHGCDTRCQQWGDPGVWHWVLADIRRYDRPVAGPGGRGLFRPKVRLPAPSH